MSDTPAPVPFKSAIGELLSLKMVWAAVILAIVGAMAFRSLLPEEGSGVDPSTLPDHGVLPEFSFTDQTGAEFSTESLRGKAAIASFIFTRCPTVCPVVSMKVQHLAETTAKAKQLLYLSFSVDPEYDTPEVLAKFAAKFEADPAQWKFLTGDPKVVRAAVEGSLKIAMDKQGTFDNGVPDIVHGSHLVLIDGNLHIRGYYDYTDGKALDQLLLDAAALLGN